MFFILKFDDNISRSMMMDALNISGFISLAARHWSSLHSNRTPGQSFLYWLMCSRCIFWMLESNHYDTNTFESQLVIGVHVTGRGRHLLYLILCMLASKNSLEMSKARILPTLALLAWTLRPATWSRSTCFAKGWPRRRIHCLSLMWQGDTEWTSNIILFF